jgi:acyl-CoA thioesterase-2
MTIATESTVDSVRELVELLDPADTGGDVFLGARGRLNLTHLFGGQVLAQGLMAAARTVTAKTAHSLHAYFLRAGDPSLPVEYRVQRLRDGRRFAGRTVSAEQRGTMIATMTVSFADTSGGVAHQRPAPAAVPVEQVPTLADAAQAWGGLGPSWIGFAHEGLIYDPDRG